MHKRTILALPLALLLGAASCSQSMKDIEAKEAEGTDYSLALENSISIQEIEDMGCAISSMTDASTILRLIRPDLEAYTSIVDNLVVGKIVRIECFLFQDTPWTKTDVTVIESLLGPYKHNDTISIFSFGGTVPLWDFVQANGLQERDPSLPPEYCSGKVHQVGLLSSYNNSISFRLGGAPATIRLHPSPASRRADRAGMLWESCSEKMHLLAAVFWLDSVHNLTFMATVSADESGMAKVKAERDIEISIAFLSHAKSPEELKVLSGTLKAFGISDKAIKAAMKQVSGKRAKAKEEAHHEPES